MKFFENWNTGHIGIVNYGTTPTLSTMMDDITYRQYPMLFPISNNMRNAANTSSQRDPIPGLIFRGAGTPKD